MSVHDRLELAFTMLWNAQALRGRLKRAGWDDTYLSRLLALF